MRRADFWTLYCPEFPLRKAPRITVRGHSVQNDSIPLRKAPLPSRACSWSTKRPCGPLAFRRATEGSRVPRKMRGSQEGQGNLGVPAPFAPAAGRRQSPAAKGGHCTRSPRAGLSHPAHCAVHSVLRPVRCVLRRMPQRRVQHRTRRHNAHHCPRDRSRRDTRYKW